MSASEALWRLVRPTMRTAAAAEARCAEMIRTAPAEVQTLLREPSVTALLAGLADHSPFLWQLACADAARLRRLLVGAPWATLADLLAEADVRSSEADTAGALRRARQSVALLVALADLGGVWSVDDVMEALSQAADVFVRLALGAALRDAHRAEKIRLIDPAAPEADCGLVVLAMGKHGARELNYSSDVDLIIFYDPHSPLVPVGAAPSPVFVRIVQRLARVLAERTADGYVLRVDLRLRPDPGSTAVAIALPAAYAYYEIFGQNWERAAMIKARPVAGDLAHGSRLLAANIRSVRLAPRARFRGGGRHPCAMKQRIAAHKGGALADGDGRHAGRLLGHDIKLGRGGIREIEFFVQTQQLIFGGKRGGLRGPCTLDMLAALHADGWVTAEAVRDLAAAYRFLRTIEHRLQMVADEQTHRLPGDPQALDAFARFCGFDDAQDFGAALGAHQTRVVHHYALLFENAPALDTALGSLVFTGVEDDPETLETLAREGFRLPAAVTETVRGWHFGRRAAVRGARAREILTELVPGLLHAFAQSGDPDAALATFDSALAHMPAATELFAILRSNAQLRALFADVLGGAPRLARAVTVRPHLLDQAVDPAFSEAALDAAAFDRRAAHALAAAETLEESLDAIRDHMQDEAFAIGLRLFSAALEPTAAGQAYSALAEAVVRILLVRVTAAFAGDHGGIAGAACVVVGLGRLGAGEMTARSDLDLMLIYDFDPAQPVSDGSRPLHAVQYYARLTQRLISALTVATRRGRLYEVDMRLRPSGRQGPLATQLRSFIAYQGGEAQTWEHMALTRARVIAGDPALASRTTEAIQAVLRRRPATDPRADVAAMREKVAAAKGENDSWDLKLAAGGLMDVDFIAQYLQLKHAADHPDLLAGSTGAVLAVARRRGLFEAADLDTLIGAHRLYDGVLQMVRLILDPGVAPATASIAVGRRLAAAADLPDFAQLVRHLAETQRAVRAIFRACVASR